MSRTVQSVCCHPALHQHIDPGWKGGVREGKNGAGVFSQCKSEKTKREAKTIKAMHSTQYHPLRIYSTQTHSTDESLSTHTVRTQLATQDLVSALTCSARGSDTLGWWSYWRCRTGGIDNGKRPWQSHASGSLIHHHWPRQPPPLDPLTGTAPADGTHAERAHVPGPAASTGHGSPPTQSQQKSLFWTRTVKISFIITRKWL